MIQDLLTLYEGADTFGLMFEMAQTTEILLLDF
jgi:hypothetical protein